MKVSVFGLGYVGSVSAACLADRGHSVIGVDLNQTKIALINEGRAPIVEEGLGEAIERNVAAKRLSATSDSVAAIADSELSFVCVATPSRANGGLDLSHIEKVCQEIGAAIARKGSRHVVVVRSTIAPGTIRGTVIPILEAATGGKAGVDFGVCNNPEFLREGTALYDFLNPPKTVIGETDSQSGDLVAGLYDGLPGPMIRCPIEVGEMVKYADNTWHAVKVAFANEIGEICRTQGIDSHRVMEIFFQDTKLNISTYYMRPGFAFGGSCLPKDLRALTHLGKTADAELPLLNSVIPSNEAQIERGFRRIVAAGSRKIGFLGYSFKAGTDDLRESPLVEVIERLIGKGFDLRLYDRNVNLAKLTGANREYILKTIPHIERLMASSIEEVLAHADTLVIGNGSTEFSTLADKLQPHHKVIDLVRIRSVESAHEQYQGMSW